ncbi:MAG TPA: hypothetical protein DCQ06_05260 [Myxococcales bacterium]|nr:hypothetical protein [Myxococcales bacterium]HAN30986.1 hypothetical protein [Myxococcales bacterium]
MIRLAPSVTTTLLVTGLILSACGGDDKDTGPVKSLCSDDEQRCYDNALLTCGPEGKSWTVGWCGQSKTCTTDNGSAGCKAVKCERNARICDGKKVLQCPADGLDEPSTVESCKSGQHCMFGQCVTTACEAGTKLCGWRAVLSCNGGSWESVKCKADQRCDPDSVTCVDQVCAPTSLKCVDNKARATCSDDGSEWIGRNCAAGQVCNDGVCHSEVQGVTQQTDANSGEPDDATSDAGASGFIDVGTKPEVVLEPFDSMKITISETPTPGPGAKVLEFGFSSANFLSVNKMLQISGDEGLYKLEIQLAPVEDFTTGTFTALEAQAEDTAILMNDGSNDQNQVQWQFQAVDYTLDITAFDDVGGRIKGTLSAKMGDAINKGQFLYIEGSFDIKRSN